MSFSFNNLSGWKRSLTIIALAMTFLQVAHYLGVNPPVFGVDWTAMIIVAGESAGLIVNKIADRKVN